MQRPRLDGTDGGLCLNSVEPESDGGPLAFNTTAMASRCSSGDHDFHPIERVRILLMAPGYRITTHELDDATQTWSPQLTKLPRFKLRVQIVPPPGEPSRVTVGYWMLEAMSFFEYSDGGVPRLVLGSGSVNDDGSFTIDLLIWTSCETSWALGAEDLVYSPDNLFTYGSSRQDLLDEERETEQCVKT